MVKDPNLPFKTKIFLSKDKRFDNLYNNSSFFITRKLPPKIQQFLQKKPERFKKLVVDILKKRSFLKSTFNCSYVNWTNYWYNSDKQFPSHVLVKIIKKICKYEDLFLNKLYTQIGHQTIKIRINTLGVFTDHKAESRFKQHLKHFQNLHYKKRLVKLAAILINLTDTKEVKFLIYNAYTPKNFGIILGERVFQKDRRERYFSASLQVLNIVFRGYISAEILGILVYQHTRRNPKRIRFISFLKRLIDWCFTIISKRNAAVSGVRVEIKGRFTAKSRTKKQILSVGRIRINEGASPVDYKQLVAITKFGSLGIKVWVCPKLNNLHNVTFA